MSWYFIRQTTRNTIIAIMVSFKIYFSIGLHAILLAGFIITKKKNIPHFFKQWPVLCTSSVVGLLIINIEMFII